jgi:tetratricopeptide (TPR) repeat protein
VGIAAGVVTVPTAALLAVSLASVQVLAQTWRQNRLGQSVVGGIALGDLDVARGAAERALAESPGGALRTLAASNLASVLLQQDLVDEAAAVLDDHPPRFLHMALTTVLWQNNRAFAHLARSFDGDIDELDDAAALLDEAERRITRANERELGGAENARKLNAALAGTRALERTFAGDGKRALQALRRAAAHDDGPLTTFRLIERELCRTEALRLVGRLDEATITLESLTAQALTPRQRRRLEALRAQVEPG